jgi:hypothetical protein
MEGSRREGRLLNEEKEGTEGEMNETSDARYCSGDSGGKKGGRKRREGASKPPL